MVCYRAFHRLVQLDFAHFYKLLDEFAMMDELIISSQLRIIMFERIEAMRTGGD